MMCLLRIEDGEIVGWIIGYDSHEMRRYCESNLWNEPNASELPNWFYANEFPRPGKHQLPGDYTLLVQ